MPASHINCNISSRVQLDKCGAKRQKCGAKATMLSLLCARYLEPYKNVQFATRVCYVYSAHLDKLDSKVMFIQLWSVALGFGSWEMALDLLSESRAVPAKLRR
jgi:hypothetical protein